MKQDLLRITQLRVMARIGVYEWEQRIEQPLLLDITSPLSRDNQAANDYLDYAKICQYTSDYLTSRAFSLIETVAEEIASELKSRFQLGFVRITVSKPLAIRNAGNISISIER